MPKNYNKHFRVTWDIDIYAPNAKEAAKRALNVYQCDPTSTATVFGVTEMNESTGKPKGKEKTIDLTPDC